MSKIWTRAMLIELASLGVRTMFVTVNDEPMRAMEELRAVGVNWWGELKLAETTSSDGHMMRWHQANGTFAADGLHLSITLSTEHVRAEVAA